MERELRLTPEKIGELEADYHELKSDVKDLTVVNTTEHKDIAKQLNESTIELSVQLSKIQGHLEQIQKRK
jgi:hypothetical protein